MGAGGGAPEHGAGRSKEPGRHPQGESLVLDFGLTLRKLEDSVADAMSATSEIYFADGTEDDPGQSDLRCLSLKGVDMAYGEMDITAGPRDFVRKEGNCR